MTGFPHIEIFGISLGLVLAITLPLSMPTAEPLIIDDPEEFSTSELFTEPIVGFRAFPAYVFVRAAEDDRPVIPAILIADAANRIEPLQARLAGIGKTVESATIDEIKIALGDITSVTTYPLDDALVISPSFEEILDIMRQEYGMAETEFYDPSFVVELLFTEMVDREFLESEEGKVAFSRLDKIPVDREFALDVLRYYDHLNIVKSLKPQDATVFFARADQRLSKYTRFASAAKQALGSLTVGRPIVLTADEAELSIPAALKREYDFFVVVFAISIKQSMNFVESVTFTVSLPEQCIAYDLFPLRYGTEIEIKSQTSSPEVSMKSQGFTVSFSSIFKREIAYSVLKPTIVAYGLQESQFAWSFREDAAGMGSHRMAAIVAVPKGFGDVMAVSSVLVETKDGILVEGSVAASAPRPYHLLTTN